MLDLSQFVGSEIMTVLSVDARQETNQWGSIIYNAKLWMLRPDASLRTSENVVAYDQSSRPFAAGEVRRPPSSDNTKKGRQVYARLSSCESQWYSRGSGPGQVELAQRVPSAATLVVVGQCREAKVVQSYIPGVKVGDAVVVSGDKAAIRAPTAPTGRVVRLSQNLSNGKVLTIDDGNYRTAFLAVGLTFQKNKHGILDFTGNVIVEILDR